MIKRINGAKQLNVLRLCAEYLIAFSMVIHCASVYVSEYQSELINKCIIIIFCSSVLMLIRLSPNMSVIKQVSNLKKNLFFILYFSVLILLRHNNMGAILKLSLELILLYNYILIDGKNGIISILKKYRSIMLVIGVISLFFWPLGSVLHIIEPTGQIYSTWTGDVNQLAVFRGYFGIHYETQEADMFDDAGLVRNTSIFNEAPMYSLHLSLALMIELFIVKKISRLNVFLLILTIVTTMSSTGIVLSAGALFIKMNIYLKKNESMRWLRYISFMFLSVGLIGVIWYLFNYRAFTMSGIIRFDDYIVAIETWLSNPLLGVGIGNYEAIRQNMGVWRSFNTGYSNSIGLLLAQGGLWIFLPFLYLFYLCIIKTFSKKMYNIAGFSFCFFYLIFFAVGIDRFNMLCVLAYLVSYIRSDGKYKKII